jgi:hypothetical protein
LRKIVLIYLIAIFILGCSVFRTKSTSEKETDNVKNGNILLEEVIKQNITERGFFIQKADVEFTAEGEYQKFIVNMRFVYPDQYLISLRSKSGIEAARIFITKDTVLINDRINKILYFGKPGDLEKRFGISYTILPLLMGDFIGSKVGEANSQLCKEGLTEGNCVVSGMKIKYLIDCNKKKLLKAQVEDNLRRNFIFIDYSSYFNTENRLIPSKINLEYNQNKIAIKIEKIESPWVGTIEFIPGNRYDLIEL